MVTETDQSLDSSTDIKDGKKEKTPITVTTDSVEESHRGPKLIRANVIKEVKPSDVSGFQRLQLMSYATKQMSELEEYILDLKYLIKESEAQFQFSKNKKNIRRTLTMGDNKNQQLKNQLNKNFERQFVGSQDRIHGTLKGVHSPTN